MPKSPVLTSILISSDSKWAFKSLLVTPKILKKSGSRSARFLRKDAKRLSPQEPQLSSPQREWMILLANIWLKQALWDLEESIRMISEKLLSQAELLFSQLWLLLKEKKSLTPLTWDMLMKLKKKPLVIGTLFSLKE